MELRGWLEFQTGDMACESLGGNLRESKKRGEEAATHTSGGREFQSGEPTTGSLDACWLPLTKNENLEGNTYSAL